MHLMVASQLKPLAIEGGAQNKISTMSFKHTELTEPPAELHPWGRNKGHMHVIPRSNTGPSQMVFLRGSPGPPRHLGGASGPGRARS